MKTISQINCERKSVFAYRIYIRQCQIICTQLNLVMKRQEIEALVPLVFAVTGRQHVVPLLCFGNALLSMELEL